MFLLSFVESSKIDWQPDRQWSFLHSVAAGARGIPFAESNGYGRRNHRTRLDPGLPRRRASATSTDLRIVPPGTMADFLAYAISPSSPLSFQRMHKCLSLLIQPESVIFESLSMMLSKELIEQLDAK